MKVARYANRLIQPLEATKWFFLIAILFRLVLEISYWNFVTPLFFYSGFVLDVSPLKYFESWILFFSLITIFPKRLYKASDYLMVYFLFSFLVPLLVFYGLSNASREHLYIILLAVFLIVIFRVGRPFKLPLFRNGRTLAYPLLGSGILVVTGWMIQSGGLGFFNLDLSLVYEFRRDAGEVINAGPMGYFNVWATKVFGPTLLAIALWKKNYLLAAVVLGLHILWFGITSHKSILFYPFLIVFLWVWFRHTKALALIPLGMTLAVIISLIVFFVFDHIFLGSLFIRRVFFVPSFLTFVYYDFFSQNQFVYWSNSFLSGAIKYPYEMGAAKVIGDYLGTDAHANNNFISTGYMHAGAAGTIFYGVLIGLLFRVIDSVSNKGVPPWVAVASVIVPMQALLTSADLPTALLTHGIGISIVILFLLRSAADVSTGERSSTAKRTKCFSKPHTSNVMQ
jgi:hypothetical protein